MGQSKRKINDNQNTDRLRRRGARGQGNGMAPMIK
jgi:hypothetical protein